MSGDGLASATRFLVLALCALYGLAMVSGPFLLDFDARRHDLGNQLVRIVEDRDLLAQAQVADVDRGFQVDQ